MICEVIFRKQFRKELGRSKLTGRDTGRFLDVIALPRMGESLPPNSRDHPLVRNFKDHRESHEVKGASLTCGHSSTDESRMREMRPSGSEGGLGQQCRIPTSMCPPFG